MSNVGSTLLECPDVQVELDSLYNTCNHAMLHRESPLTQYIMSDQNRSGIQQLIFPGRGKLKNVQMRYDQKATLDSFDEVDDCNLNCAAGDVVGDLSTMVEVDPCLKIRSTPETYDAVTLARICRDNYDFIINRINILASGLEAKVATKFAEDAIPFIGQWASDVTPLTGGNTLQLVTRQTGNILIDPLFPSRLSMATRRTGYCGPHAIFGSSTLYMDTDALNIGCCADSGLNLFESLMRWGKTTMWDPYVVAALGGDDRNAIMLMLGALQPIFVNLGSEAGFEGISGPRSSNFEVIPMVTPRYGIPFDLIISNNCGALTFTLETSPHLTAMPMDMFPVSDVYEGVNFINQIQHTAAA